MCLLVEAVCSASDREALEAAAIAASSAGLHVDLDHRSRRPWAQNSPARALISEEGGCSCSLLSDDADWNAETWSMRPDVLDRLALTLELLAMQGPDGLVVQALWVGDEPKNTVSVSPRELADVARLGKLGTRTRYAVARDTAG